MFTEKEIQNYIWSVKDNWADLIEPFIPPGSMFLFSKDLGDIYPEKLIYNSSIRRLQRIYDNITKIDLIGVEVPLSKVDDSTIRADFLGANFMDIGITIIELKKSKQTERQVFTELFAYGNHCLDLFPTMSKNDITYVLISPMEERIVREAFIYSLIFEHKSIFAFVPRWTNPQDIKSLRLIPWIPDIKVLSQISKLFLLERNFDVIKVVWERIPGWWNNEDNSNPTDYQKHLMNTVSGLAAQLMEERGIHGFCFTSQTWPELDMPYPNSLVIVGLNPYSIGLFKHLFANKDLQDRHLWQHYNDIGLPDFIPGLSDKNHHIHEDTNYFEGLRFTWMENLYAIALEVLHVLLKNTDGRSISTERDSFTWDVYKEEFIEYIFCFNFDVKVTGVLRRLYSDVICIDYDVISDSGLEGNPIYGDIFKYSAESFIRHDIFRKFIIRMFENFEEDILHRQEENP